jgi:hypothetical protein
MMIKGILRRMADLKKIHRLVSRIDKENKKLTKGIRLIGFDDDPRLLVDREVVLKKFKQRRFRKDISEFEAERIYRLAEPYILELRVTKPVQTSLTLEVTTHLKPSYKGLELTSRTCFRAVPKGLILEWTNKNSTFHNLMFGLVGGFIIGIIGTIVAIMR